MDIEYRRKINLDIDVERQIRVWPQSAIVILIFVDDMDGSSFVLKRS